MNDQTVLGQTPAPTLARLARSLLDLEDDHLGWDKVKPSFSYKQRAWVNAVEQLVAAPVADPVAELSVLQKLTLQLQAAIKPAALPSWFRLTLPRWKSAVSSSADVATLHEAIAILGAACRAEEPPSPEWKTEQPPAMPEGCLVVKTEVKAEDKQVPAWPVDAYVEVQVKQEVKQERLEPLAPVVRQGAAGSSGKTKMQEAPHMRRRPASPGEASDEEPAAPGSAKRARTSSGDGPVQPGSARAREEAADAPGWEQEPLDELDDEGGGGGGGGGAGWLPDPMGVDSDDEGGAGPAGADEEDRAMTPERDVEEEDEEDDGEEDEVSSEEDSDDGSALVSEADSEEEEDDADDAENGQSDEEEPGRGRRAPAARRRAGDKEAPSKPGPSAVLSAAWMQGEDSDEEDEGATAHASVGSIESSEVADSREDEHAAKAKLSLREFSRIKGGVALLKDCIDRASASQLGLVDASVRARLEDFTTSSISQHRALRQLQLRAYKAMTKLQVLRGSYADLPGDDDGSDSEDDRPQRPKKAATEPDIEQAYVKARTIAEKFVLQALPPGGNYYDDPRGVTTNPIGHPSRQHVLLFQGALMELVMCDPTKESKHLLVECDAFRAQRHFLEEQLAPVFAVFKRSAAWDSFEPPVEAPSDLSLEASAEDAIGGGGAGPEQPAAADSYADYVPAKLDYGPVHIEHVVESASLSCVLPTDVTYSPQLPAETLSSGVLSRVQLEAVIYALQQHERLLPSGQRAGFFIGDGTGVGKGRELAAIIWENWNRGRKRAVWLTCNTDLLVDAERDLHDVGCKHIAIKSLSSMGYGPIAKELKEGVLLVTYSCLIAHSGTGGSRVARMTQLEAWLSGATDAGSSQGGRDWRDFDGVLAFDEAHKAKGAAHNQPVGKAVVKLQETFPKARVVYLSATGATQVSDMSYMSRLGLWGTGTSAGRKCPSGFPRDYAPCPCLVAPRTQIARTHPRVQPEIAWLAMAPGARLGPPRRRPGTYFTPPGTYFPSFSSIENILHAGGSAGAMEMLAVQLKSSGAYLARNLGLRGVDFNVRPAQLTAEQTEMYDDSTELWFYIHDQLQAFGLAGWQGIFTSAYTKYFQQLVLSFKVPLITKLARRALRAGKCVVIGLQSTGAAATASVGKNATLQTLVSAAREAVEGLLDRLGSKSLNSVFVGSWAVFRQTVDRKLDDLALPPAALDALLDFFGAQHVAEMTGRSHRLQRSTDGGYRLVSRAEQGVALANLNLTERARFQRGEKLIAILSDAGATGVSLHADKNQHNQRRRLHIVPELGWSASKIVQQFGRTHRTNQLMPPEYMLLSCDSAGEKLTSSAVARKLEGLGALTKGDRSAGQGETGGVGANLEGKAGQDALRQVTQHHGAFLSRTFMAAGWTDPNSHAAFKMLQESGTVKQFLTRLQLMPLGRQQQLLKAFLSKMESNDNARATQLTSTAIKITKEEVVFRNPRNAAENVSVKEIEVNHLCRWEEALQLVSATEGFKTMTQTWAGFFLHFRTENGPPELFAVIPIDDSTGRSGRVRICYPSRTYASKVHVAQLVQLVQNGRLKKLGGTTGVARAQRSWQKQVAQALKDGTHLVKFALMNGSVFSIWHNVRQAMDPLYDAAEAEQGRATHDESAVRLRGGRERQRAFEPNVKIQLLATSDGEKHGGIFLSTVRPLVHASQSTNEACNKLRYGEAAYCRRHGCMQEGYSELDKLKVSLRMHRRELFSGQAEESSAALVQGPSSASLNSDEED